MIVKVLSDSTASDDRGDKWAHYQRLPSLRHYVLVSQKEKRVEIFTRADHRWHYEDVREIAPIRTPPRASHPTTIGATLDVRELYDGAAPPE